MPFFMGGKIITPKRFAAWLLANLVETAEEDWTFWGGDIHAEATPREKKAMLDQMHKYQQRIYNLLGEKREA